MKYDDRYIVELSRAAIFDDTPFVPEESINWEYVYNKSIEQNITGLLFTAVSKLPDEYRPGKDLFNKWQQKMLETIAVTSRQYNEFLRMSKIFSNNDIKIVVLKGGFIRRIYLPPELRTMGDFDILVKKADINRAAQVLKKEGYDINKAVFGIEAKNKNAYWEVFYLLEEEFVYEPEKYTQEVYNSSFTVDNFFVPEPALFLTHLIVHTGKHYIEKGAGIRNLLDITLYIKKYAPKIDFVYVEKICKEQNFLKIYRYIINALEDWYKIDLSFVEYEKVDTDLFMEYTLLNGIFGKHGNVLLRQMSLDERENSRGIVRLFFPPVKTLKDRYKYLRKFPFLLPLAWVQRVMFGVFVKKVSIKNMIKDIDEAVEFSDERMKWLNDLDLKDSH